MSDTNDTPNLDERLRRVLQDEARRLDPTDPLDAGLVQIRRRTDAPVPVGARRWFVPVMAAAAVLAVVVVGAMAWPRGSATPVVGSSTSPTPSASTSLSQTTSPSPSNSPSPSGTPSGGPAVTVGVYYGGTFGGRTMLYREFHRTTSEPLSGALQAMLSGPADPDYASLWPRGTTLRSVTRSGSTGSTGSTVTVTLSADPLVLPPGPGLYGASSVQEVVYTVTAADATIRAVTVVYPGGQSTAVVRAPAVNVLASVWLLAPIDGSSVSSPVTLSGTASVFEAVVNWEVDRTDGTVVAQGSAMATIGGPGRGPWSTTVSLPAGSYVAKAFEISAKDGSVTWTDSKAFTVR